MRNRIFWADLLRELTDAKLTQREIAGRVGSSQPAISRLCNGETDDPLHSVGQALLDLHAAHMGPVAHARLIERFNAQNVANAAPAAIKNVAQGVA